ALVLGLLAGSLNRAPFGRAVVDFNSHPERVCNTGQFVVVLDVARLRPLSEFTTEIDGTLDDFRNSARLPGHDVIRLPGDQRHRHRQAQMQNGLSLSLELTNQLDALAKELGITMLGARSAALHGVL